MTESGKIDWACHANDAAASIHDVLELSNAVEDVYKRQWSYAAFTAALASTSSDGFITTMPGISLMSERSSRH